MALVRERDTARRELHVLSMQVAANVRIFKGALVVFDGGYAAPGRTATGLIAAGRAEQTIDNRGGAAGAERLNARRGTFCYPADPSDPVTQASLGRDCFIVDDGTIAATDGGGTRSRAGKVIDIEPDGRVWVEIL